MFLAAQIQACNAVNIQLNPTAGPLYIHSWSYPEKYTPNSICSMRITWPSGVEANVDVLDIAMTPKLSRGCYDYAAIKDSTADLFVSIDV